MRLFLATMLFSVVILIYWIILELFTVMFRTTGLPDEKARFQVLSLLTGTGFTTRESESITSSRVRRRLANVTMLFGYVFNVTIISVLINLFLTLKLTQLNNIYLEIVIPLACTALVIRLIRTRTIRKRIDRALGHLAGRVMRQDNVNTILLMDYIGNNTIANVILKKVPEELFGKKLSEAHLLREKDILILLVERRAVEVEAARSETVLMPGDRLTVFGPYHNISQVFQAEERFS